MRPYIIGVAGGTASGKTTLAQLLYQRLGTHRSAIIALDSYYHSRDNLTILERERVNYDHPDSLEAILLARHIEEIKSGSTVRVPIYDYALHTRSNKYQEIQPTEYVIVEGILVLHFQEVCRHLDYKIFVDTPSGLRLERRLQRDIRDRGRTAAMVYKQWNETVTPMHQQYCEPSKIRADLQVIGVGDYQRELDEIQANIIKKPSLHEA